LAPLDQNMVGVLMFGFLACISIENKAQYDKKVQLWFRHLERLEGFHSLLTFTITVGVVQVIRVVPGIRVKSLIL